MCWAVAALLFITTSTLVYLFIVRGQTLPASDGRTSIVLNAGERDLVLAEMRDFLVALQSITAAAVNDDVKAVVDAAQKVGGAAQHSVPASLVGKLPLPFKRLGFDTHSRFDTLAENAEAFGSTAPVLEEMATLMRNCTGCHAAYRIEVSPP